MAVSYKKLWKLLIDRDMKKKDLCEAAGISHASVAKLGKNENVTTDVLVKICTALKCDLLREASGGKDVSQELMRFFNLVLDERREKFLQFMLWSYIDLCALNAGS